MTNRDQYFRVKCKVIPFWNMLLLLFREAVTKVNPLMVRQLRPYPPGPAPRANSCHPSFRNLFLELQKKFFFLSGPALHPFSGRTNKKELFLWLPLALSGSICTTGTGGPTQSLSHVGRNPLIKTNRYSPCTVHYAVQ